MATQDDKSVGKGSRSGRSARRELIEAEIYEQAARLFAERGYAGTTPQDIADAVGVSRQALYYYISSKEQLLETLVSEMTVQIVADMKAIIDQKLDPAETLFALAHHLVTDRATNKTRFRLLDRSESALPEDLARAYLEGRRAALAILVDVVDDGITAGVFQSVDARVSALSVLGMCNWVAWWFEPAPDHPIEPIATQIANSAVAMLRRPTDGRTPAADAADLIDVLMSDLVRLKRLI